MSVAAVYSISVQLEHVPNTRTFGQMPANGPPMFTSDQTNSMAAWIDADVRNDLVLTRTNIQ